MNKILIFLVLINFAAAQQLLNVSYDATRELFKEYNALFIKYYEQKSGKKIKILQSHGGSGAQARMLIDGLKADVATLALAYDINAVARKSGALDASWQEEFPLNSAPYNSTIVFLVRKGNPKGIKDWDDLVRNDVKIVTPNPKTSGGARYNHLAAYAYAAAKFDGDEDKIREFLVKLYANAPVLDAGARGSANTFIRRGIGDAMIAWENEAHLSKARLGEDEFEIIYPSLSILAQPPVAVLSKNATANDNVPLAREYLARLYLPDAQEIIAKNFFRPTDESVAKKYEKIFPRINLISIESFGGWDAAQKRHFSDGGEFDKIYEIVAKGKK